MDMAYYKRHYSTMLGEIYGVILSHNVLFDGETEPLSVLEIYHTEYGVNHKLVQTYDDPQECCARYEAICELMEGV